MRVPLYVTLTMSIAVEILMIPLRIKKMENGTIQMDR